MRRASSACVLLVLLGFAQAGWLPEERLTERTDQPDRTCPNNARAATFDPAGNLHVVWHGISAGLSQVWYSRRDGLTGEWSVDTVISTDTSGAQHACVVADNSGGIHVAWTTLDSTAVRYRRRPPADTWDTVETARITTLAETPSIAIGQGDSVFVAWSERTLTNAVDVLVVARGAGGWGTAECLSSRTEGHFSRRPSVAASEQGQLAVAWQSYGGTEPLVAFRPRDDTGWGRVDTLAYGFSCNGPSLYVSPASVVHCVWRRELVQSRWALVYRQRRGAAWLDTVQLPRPGRNVHPGSVLADGAGNVHAVYAADTARADTHLYYISADDSGRNWTTPTRLAGVDRKCENPTLCVGPADELAVAWTDHRHSANNPDVFVRRTGVVRDVAVTELFAPDTVDSAQSFSPAVVVANQGEEPESFAVWLTLPGGYAESLMVSGLAPGGGDTLEFAAWPAHARGGQAVKCSIPPVPGDTCPANNVLSRAFFVRVRDFAAESLDVPASVERGETLEVRVSIGNRGNMSDSGRLWLEVRSLAGTLLHRDSGSLSLGPGACTTLAFRTVPVETSGFVACSTACAGDMRVENNVLCDTFVVLQSINLEITEVYPRGVVDSAVVVQPRVVVRNSGSALARFTARMWIDPPAYMDTTEEHSVPAGESLAVGFREWTPGRPGWAPVACSLFLQPGNVSGPVGRCSAFVRVLDAAAESITSPRGALPARDTVRPVAVVGNRGNDTASFAARFVITDSLGRIAFEDSASVRLDPHSSASVRFRDWLGLPGAYRAACRVRLPGDMRPHNDSAGAEFTLHVGNLALGAIIAPGERVDSGAAVVPRIRVRNLGDEPAGFRAWFGIADGYADSVDVPGLPGGRDTTLEFRSWLALTRGAQALACSLLVLPESTAVGPLRGETFVRVIDAAAEDIVAPRGTVLPGLVVPVVRISNPGNEEGRAVCRLLIAGAGYEDSVDLVLRAGADTAISFTAWRAVAGRYDLVATVRLPGDARPANDTCRAVVSVDSVEAPQWQRLADLPGARPVRRGGRLVATSAGLHGLRGTGTGDWYRYAADGDSWCALAPVPAGPDGRRVREGAAAAWSGGDSVFLFPGRGRRAFLCYRPSGSEWDTLVSLPEGLRAIRHGTGLAHVRADTERVFLATGSGRHGFLACYLRLGRWHARRPVPEGPAGRGCRYGTDLVAHGERVFLLKGGTSEFYEYFPRRDSWAARADLPATGPGGRHRRAGRGAALAADGAGSVFALRGRGGEFWRYDLAGDSWTRLEDVPPGPGRRKVGGGAGLACLGGRVFLLKGGGSREFWRYDPAAPARAAGRSGVAARPASRVLPMARVTIARGVLHAGHDRNPRGDSGSCPKCVLLDISGRKVLDLKPGANDVRHLSPGIYFVRAVGREPSAASHQRVVVTR
ncbi:MAG: hypothetical protein R6X12_09925 [bacterium]